MRSAVITAIIMTAETFVRGRPAGARLAAGVRRILRLAARERVDACLQEARGFRVCPGFRVLPASVFCRLPGSPGLWVLRPGFAAHSYAVIMENSRSRRFLMVITLVATVIMVGGVIAEASGVIEPSRASVIMVGG